MNHYEVYKVSKWLSYVLRHDPTKHGLVLDAQGFVSVNSVISAFNASGHGKWITFKDLEFVVEHNDKKRFAFSPNATKIRAVQGHSVKVDLGYTPIEPPEFLYHGTASHMLPSIEKKGIIPGRRQHVHLPMDEQTAINVGSRHGIPVVLEVKSGEMHRAGREFYLADNGVWLTDCVPVGYFSVWANVETT